METIQKVFTLRKVDLFKELPGEILFIIAEEMEATEMSQGQIVFNEGDPPTGLYIVVSGEVEILKGQDIIATLKEANFFGELALIDNSTRSATARAKGEGMLLFLEKDVFDRITEDIPEVLRVVVQTIVSYLRKYISVDKIVQSQPIAPG